MNDKEFYEQLGKRIKARREEFGMSQEQLAEKIGYKGKSTISMIEAGTRGLRHFKNRLDTFCKSVPCGLFAHF